MSLINDALKRASESQAQAATRPRGPKGVEDLPVPMTPVSARERPAWVPVVGIGLLIVALLGASGFFFAKWWKERKAWQPYATEDIDENGMPRTNATAKVAAPKAPSTQVAKAPVTPAPAGTNPPVVAKAPVTPPAPAPEPPKTNPPTVSVAIVTPAPPPTTPEPPAPKATNPVANVPTPPPAKQPDPVVPAPPPVSPPAMAKVETNPAHANPPPVKPAPPAVPPDTTKKGDDHAAKVAAVEFPELKLQGISRRKNKTFAVLNGKTLSLGDRIDGVILLKIDTDSVIVEKGGARRELFLLR
jgi:hypothetical protein